MAAVFEDTFFFWQIHKNSSISKNVPFIRKLLWGHNLKIERTAFCWAFIIISEWRSTVSDRIKKLKILLQTVSSVECNCNVKRPTKNEKLCTKMIKRVRFVLTLFLHMFGDVNYSYRLFLLSVCLRVRIGIVWTKKNAVWLAFVLKIYIINNNNILLRSHTSCCIHIFERKKKFICLLAILPIKILSHRKICRIYHCLAIPFIVWNLFLYK